METSLALAAALLLCLGDFFLGITAVKFSRHPIKKTFLFAVLATLAFGMGGMYGVVLNTLGIHLFVGVNFLWTLIPTILGSSLGVRVGARLYPK